MADEEFEKYSALDNFLTKARVSYDNASGGLARQIDLVEAIAKGSELSETQQKHYRSGVSGNYIMMPHLMTMYDNDHSMEDLFDPNPFGIEDSEKLRNEYAKLRRELASADAPQKMSAFQV